MAAHGVRIPGGRRLIKGSWWQWYLLANFALILVLAGVMAVHGWLGGTWADVFEFAYESDDLASEEEVEIARGWARFMDNVAPPLSWSFMAFLSIGPATYMLLLFMHRRWRSWT